MSDTPSILRRLEPEVDVGQPDPNLILAASIAISLRRIADVLEGTKDKMGVIDSLFEVVNNLKNG